MTVGELKELLESYDDEQEVRLMTQSQWPFENDVLGVCSTSDMDKDDTERDEPRETDPDADVVYIVEGSQIGYGRKVAWEVVNR